MEVTKKHADSSKQRRRGAALLLISVAVAILTLFLDWVQMPYVADSSVGHVRIATYPIKLIDVLRHTVAAPAGVAPPYISPLVILTIELYLLGSMLWGIGAIFALRAPISLKWLFPIGVGYILLIGCVLILQQMGMSLSALSDPYVGVTPTIAQWLLLPYCACISGGSYLVAR